MSDVAVAFARDQVEAEVVASALRVERLHPRIALDTPLTGGGLISSTGRRVVYVPEDEAAKAREILDETEPEEPQDNPVLRLVIIVAIITGLLLATPFVSGICAGPS